MKRGRLPESEEGKPAFVYKPIVKGSKSLIQHRSSLDFEVGDTVKCPIKNGPKGYEYGIVDSVNTEFVFVKVFRNGVPSKTVISYDPKTIKIEKKVKPKVTEKIIKKIK